MNKSPKISKNKYCENCDYSCSKLSEWNKHISTQKHKKLTDTNEKISNPKTYECKCGKVYKHCSSLINHRKKCMEIIENHITLENNEANKDTSKETHSNDFNTKNDNFSNTKNELDAKAFLKMIKQNEEFKNLLIEQNAKIMKQNEEIMELTKNSKNITTNNNNNHFNLNIFLNEDCKHAMNLNKFIENINLEISDLLETKRLGYINVISRILINNLRELDMNMRPLHCTDIKRETVYIKNNDRWEKEPDDKPNIIDAIRKIEKKNLKLLPLWQQENPQSKNTSTPEYDEYVTLSLSAFGEAQEENIKKQDNKIMKNLLTEIVIDKKMTKI
jgi:hypothetical protein